VNHIEQIPTNRPDLFAFAVTGKISETDMERMAATVEAGFDRFETIDMLITMPGYDGLELGAMFDKEGLGAMLRSNAHVRRYAVVGAPIWAKAMINLFGPLSPVETKTFDEEGEAWAWVGGARESV
jgi:hypothetical protein